LSLSQDNNNGCPSDSYPVNCLQNPCTAKPAPVGCANYTCVPNYCGGCNRYYVDLQKNRVNCEVCPRASCGPELTIPNYDCIDQTRGGPTGRCVRDKDSTVNDDNTEIKCVWEVRQCPCGPVCDIYCKNGHVLDQNGCKTCQCNPIPNCLNSDFTPSNLQNCSKIECKYGVFVPEDSCCPRCKPNCSDITCVNNDCDPQTQKLVYPPSACCPRCEPITVCTNVECPQVIECPLGFRRVKKECCSFCEQIIDCRNVDCSNVQCRDDQKKIIVDGDCCPKCVDIPPCTNANCSTKDCPQNTMAVQFDLNCCKGCVPIDHCATVLCAQPECDKSEQIMREGQCCAQCPLCVDNDRKSCTTNDDTVCRPGFTKGDNCSVNVTDGDRKERTFKVRFCFKDSDPCPTPEDIRQMIKIRLALLAIIKSQYISIEIVAGPSSDCCYVFKVTIAREITDDTINENVYANTLSSSIQSNPDSGFTLQDATSGIINPSDLTSGFIPIPEDSDKSSASSLKPSFLLFW